MSENKFDRLIKDSLDKGFEEISFSEEYKQGIINEIKEERFKDKIGSLMDKIKSMLNHEVEIPVSYAVICGLFVVGFLGYDINSYFPGSGEINSYHLEWIEIEYRGLL
ncbi:MAG: hypothetical protein ACOCRZ_05045 [Halothermotrichaceae bacterium]